MSVRSVVAAAVLVAVPAVPAVADIAPGVLTAGAGFAPPENDKAAQQIEMKSEHVVLTAHDSAAGPFVVVDATFKMAGKKPGRTLNVVFPGEGVMVGGAYVTHPRLVGFMAFVDGTPVASKDSTKTHSTQSGPPGREYTKTRTETWHAFSAPIDDDTTVRVRYAIAAESYGDRDTGAAPHARAQYILHTGALWAGAIGSATVEVKGVGVNVAATSLRTLSMSPPSLVSLAGPGAPPPVTPAGATRTPTSIVFTQTNLEPKDEDDVEVVFPSAHADNAWGRVSEELAAAMLAAVRAR